MRVLVVTSEYPSDEHPSAGIFVQRQVAALSSLGVDIRVFSFRGRASITQYLRAFRDLRNRLAHEEYDLIHAHWGQAGLLACLATRIPVVVTFHGSDVFGLGRESGEEFKSVLLRAASRLAAHLAGGVITVSPKLKLELHRNDAHVILMGIDRCKFYPVGRDEARAQLGWPLNERTVLFVGGTNNPIKRFSLARDAVTRAAGSFEFPVSLRVCENEAPEKVPIFMNAADVLLITSQHEGGPLVLREALACNLPVVSVDVGDARTRLARVPGCILAGSDKPEAIASALVNVLNDCKRVDGAVGISDLDEQAIARKVVTVYESVCARSFRTGSPLVKPSASS